VQSGVSPTFVTMGTISVPPGRTNFVRGGEFNYAGGIRGGGGTLALQNCILDLGPDLSNESTVLQLQAVTVNGPGRLINATGQTLLLNAATMKGPLENRGSLIVQSITRFDGPFISVTG